MLSNRSMPASTVIPTLPYSSVGDAADWLGNAFGFTVRLRIGDHRIQMNAGDGAIVLVEQISQRSRASVLVRVEDVDAHHAKAAAFGAKIASSPQSFPYGERQYTVIDCGGHAWTFSQSVADVAPEDWGGASGDL
jgi:uncharacterized glyoxalase superfamily protein PhnB